MSPTLLVSLALLFIGPLVQPPGSPASKEDIPPEAATGTASKSLVRAKRQMVVAANPLASAAGQEILRAGGSATDAAIATALVLGLVEPQSSGIGGGAFMVHWDARTRAMTTFDGRETAPAAATPDQFLDENGAPRSFFAAVVGGLSVGVPGQLRLFELAHQKHGRLPWKRLFEPAIRLADAGFHISPRLHKLLLPMVFLAGMPPASTYFYQPDGSPKPVGTLLRNPELAAVLRAVATDGVSAFYEGPIAAAMVETVQKAPRNPGRLTLEDLRGYRAIERPPVCATWHGFRVCGMPPPTSGGITTLQILKLLERFDLAALDHQSARAAHLFLEASRLAYADRALYIADPAFVTPAGAMDGLLDDAYLRERSRRIDPKRAAEKVTPGKPPGSGADLAPDNAIEMPSTSHLCVVDADGNAVSMTNTIESAFGSHLMVKGFLLNNEMTDFSFVPEVDGQLVQNRVQPGKRPRSSMAPIIALGPDGSPRLLVGSPGGSRIISYVARVLVAVLAQNLDVQAAISAPNLAGRGSPVELERTADKAAQDRLADALRALGHTVRLGEMNSGLHAIEITKDGLEGGADPRREGIALGD